MQDSKLHTRAVEVVSMNHAWYGAIGIVSSLTNVSDLRIERPRRTKRERERE